MPNQGPTPATRGRRPPAWLAAAPAVLLLAWGGNHFTPLLHLYETLGDYTAWQANLLLGTYVAGLVPGLLVAAALSDRHGRKPVLAIGVGLSILGSVLLAVGLHDFVLLCIGRAFAGAGVGIAMSVGTSWMKELSSAPFETGTAPAAGAKRPALTLTLGFGVGAAATGLLAQWGPAPAVTPYVLHIALSTFAFIPLLRTPESLGRHARATEAWWRDLRVPAAGHRRFTRLVLPAAPWVFAAAGIAYAVMPAVVEAQLGETATLYATVLTVVTLGTGAVVQSFVPRIDRATGGRALTVGLSLMTGGMLLAALAAQTEHAVLALIVAALLGAAYGITIVAGLVHVQAIATPQDLAGLTGVYYSLTYIGFLLPALLAALLPLVSYAGSLLAVAAVAALSLGLVAGASRGRG